MSYLLADPNTWYTITSQVNFKTPNNASLEPYWPGGVVEDSVFLSNTNNLTKFQWQLYPVTQPANGSYLLRPRVDPGGWLAAWTKMINDPSCVSANVDCTRLANLWPNLSVNGVWTFQNAEDGTNSFYLSDGQDGSGYHLDLWPDQSHTRMTNQTNPAPITQQFQIIPTAQINDPVFQSINSSVILFDNSANTVPNVTYPSGSGPSATPSTTSGTTISTPPASTTTTPSSPTPTPIPHPHGSIIAGVVAGVGAAFILLGIWIWWFLRRRKRQAAYHPANPNTNSPTASENLKLPPYGDSTPKQGTDGVYEVEGDESLRHELSDGTGVQHELSGDERARHELAGDAGHRYELPG